MWGSSVLSLAATSIMEPWRSFSALSKGSQGFFVCLFFKHPLAWNSPCFVPNEVCTLRQSLMASGQRVLLNRTSVTLHLGRVQQQWSITSRGTPLLFEWVLGGSGGGSPCSPCLVHLDLEALLSKWAGAGVTEFQYPQPEVESPPNNQGIAGGEELCVSPLRGTS